ncbi:hypothetical protein OEB99_01005 [Actinotalea sp. M2MS4P-6]|uniref:hypothetical protein n=1 Tax=Actinotalea sp. M2MS4P-6 TaxID=2983762 RepID=UPI0021E50385|nr:hypothetical protein [Actinotalea sp. M2MS4P-6]MCV2392875.1 hypothetical protein [Actinotalea sp. M2MS4P-6]
MADEREPQTGDSEAPQPWTTPGTPPPPVPAPGYPQPYGQSPYAAQPAEAPGYPPQAGPPGYPPPYQQPGEQSPYTQTGYLPAQGGVPGPGGVPAPGGPAPRSNPGMTLGVVSIALAAFMLWIVGIPLAIWSLVRSGKADASRVIGFAALAANLLMVLVSVATLAVLLPLINAARDEAAAPIPTVSVEPTPAEPSPTESSADASPTESGSPTSDAAEVIGLDEAYTVGGSGDAFWSIPGSVSGWDLTTFDDQGVNEFTRADGEAYFTTFQGVDPAYAGLSDLDGSYQVVGDVIGLSADEIAADATTTTLPQTSGDRAVELVVFEWTSDTHDGITAGRVFDDGHYLALSYYTPTESFDYAEWDAFIAQIAIDDSGS